MGGARCELLSLLLTACNDESLLPWSHRTNDRKIAYSPNTIVIGVGSLFAEAFDRKISGTLPGLPCAGYSAPQRLVHGFTCEPELLVQ